MGIEYKDEENGVFKEIRSHVTDIEVDTSEKSGEKGPTVEEIESLCMECEEQGKTKLLLTIIPFFREIIIMSFECPYCGFKNSEIQSAGTIEEKGSIYTFVVESKEDLNRNIIKSETSSILLVELELEIPPGRGKISNIEGFLKNACEDLSLNQPIRKYQEPELYEKIEEFIGRIYDLLEGMRFPFKIQLNDPAGNSWIEMEPGDPQYKWQKVEYERTYEQNAKLGLYNSEEVENEENFQKNEVHKFSTSCPNCIKPCDTNMKLVDIPYFKEVIIMSTVCDECGYKSNEVKTGGEIPEKGKKITLKVENIDDLSRDVLKSETCAITIPELSLDLHPGTLGGRFTTLEGLLAQVYDELYKKIYSKTNDSMEPEKRERWDIFLQRLQDARNAKIKFTIILDDPTAGSYLQNLYAPDPDPNMTIEEYERTYEQNEDLGLNDMVLNPETSN
ncbi:hypothetical protein T552_01453 [Pneumocystis carinii B80]|uniref:Zinc finger ZPR1-type domain-containing protein n=1 Tax=Pneumocystis carinii (strain B80) TaxID=1408658 RepID=A0A0W4ZKE8_PNEC8|nr:hypothetical protein T552_01453 [Pneumocystis carinii B80]KTW28824.1 hypothetical protein T552_01453 [Pneumocystis carinii B80]